MEFVKKHVAASGNTTLRGFFSSDNVDFDPPSLSLRANVTKAKSKRVYDLADGSTDDDDEDEIRDIMSQSDNSYELIRLVGVMDGWEGLDDELPEGHVDNVAFQLAQVLDQRDYVVYQFVRRYLVLLDYNASPNLGDCFVQLLEWPVEFQEDEIDLLLSQKVELLKRVTSATMRERTNMVAAARILPIVVAQTIEAAPHRAGELVALMHEVNYTTRICGDLARLFYTPLYDVIRDTVDPDPTKTLALRVACRDTLQRLEKEFAAAAKAVELIGDNAAKTTVNRFMSALKAALDNFSPTLPAPTAVGAIVSALGGVGNTFADLTTAITNLPDVVSGITLPDLLGTDDDDKARDLIGQLFSQGWLAHASFDVKRRQVRSLLDGWTVDSDEIGIIRVLEAAKGYDQAELYQLVAAATWEDLYSSVDGDEYDTMEGILGQPV